MKKKRNSRAHDASIELLDRMLNTLENRREQISARSTVSLAAASGVLVLAVQLVFDISDLSSYQHYFLVALLSVISVVTSSLSIITSLDLIKRISRKKHKGKNQNAFAPNIFYFGWISKNSEEELNAYLSTITEREKIEYEIRQAISLSENLKYRYGQLKKTYILFIVGLLAYMCSVIIFVVKKYNIFELLTKFGGGL